LSFFHLSEIFIIDTSTKISGLDCKTIVDPMQNDWEENPGRLGGDWEEHGGPMGNNWKTIRGAMENRWRSDGVPINNRLQILD
jgi:hypothetical protein